MKKIVREYKLKIFLLSLMQKIVQEYLTKTSLFIIIKVSMHTEFIYERCMIFIITEKRKYHD